MIYDGGAATDMICRVIPFCPPRLLGWGGAPALLVVSRVVAGATNDMPAVGLRAVQAEHCCLVAGGSARRGAPEPDCYCVLLCPRLPSCPHGLLGPRPLCAVTASAP